MKAHRIGGKHRQPSGREVTYWAVFGDLIDGDVAVYAVFSAPMWTYLGSVDLSLPPSDIPLALRVRSSVLSYIDATEFRPGTQPGPRWIGWRGALLYGASSSVSTSPEDAIAAAGFGRVTAGALVGIAHELRLSVIASGVLEAEHAEVLRQLNCDAMVGPAVSAPMTISEAPTLLKKAAVAAPPRTDPYA